MNTCSLVIISLSLAVSIGPWTARAGWLEDALRPVEVVSTQDEIVSHPSQYRRTADALAELGRVAPIRGGPLVGSGRLLLRPVANDPRVPILRSRLRLPAIVEADSALYDPALLDRFAVQAESFTYRLRQEPGPLNPRDFPERFDLPYPVPVYLVYWTAWVGDDGIVRFRDDVYDRDGRPSMRPMSTRCAP